MLRPHPTPPPRRARARIAAIVGTLADRREDAQPAVVERMAATRGSRPQRHGAGLAAARRLALCVGPLLCVGPAQQALALRIEYTADLQAEHNDNVQLTDDDAISSNLLMPGLGVLIRHESSTLRTEIAGRALHRRYDDDRFDGATDATLRGTLDWTIVPERLSFSVVDDLSLQPVDTFAADAPGNRQQINILSAGPTLQFRGSPSWRGAAELRWIRSDAEVTDEFDSQRVLLALRSNKALGRNGTLSVNAQTQRVDFDDDLLARDYRRDDVYLRYVRTLARFDLGLDAGWSRLDYRRARVGFADGRDDPLLRAEFAWRPEAGHRIGLQYSREFSDVTGDALYSGTIAEPGDPTPPPAIVTGDTVVNASPYLDQRLQAGYEYTSTRLSAGVTPHVERIRYSDDDRFDQNGRGLGLELDWRARRTLSLGFSAAYDRIEYITLDRIDSTRRYTLRARYEWTRRWSATAGLQRYERRSSEAGESADQTLFTVGVTYANR